MPDLSLISSVPPRDTADLVARVKAWFSQPDATLAKSQGACAYRQYPASDEFTPQACGIGCAIPEAMYHEDFEEIGVIGGIFNAASCDEGQAQDYYNLVEGGYEAIVDLKSFFRNVPMEDLEQLQQIHDHLANDAEHLVEIVDGEMEAARMRRCA